MANIDSQFVADADRIGPTIYTKTINSSAFAKLIPKEPWPDGYSESIQVLTVERNLPDNIDDWTALLSNDGTGNTCNPEADEVPAGQTLRTYNLEQKRIKSLPICVNDTRPAFQIDQQVKAMFDNLTNAVKYVWARRSKLEYSRLAEHKMVAAPGLPQSSTHFPTIAPTTKLTQEILNIIYQELIVDSAEMDGGSLGMVNGAPQFILVTDMATSNDILHQYNTQQAFLWNNTRVPELLQPLGIDRAYLGFYHSMDNLPRRWNFTGGAWVEVLPYESAVATKGTKQKISAAYRTAEYMDSVVFLPSVMSFMVPKPISTVGSQTSFTPQQYMGDFRWLNILSDATNPLGETGYYMANIQSGSKPVHPEFGYVIRHKRCPADIGTRDCTESVLPDSSDLGSGESFLV